MWSPGREKETKRFAFKGSILALEWSPDGAVIVVGSQDATVQFWRVRTGGQSFMEGYQTKLKELAWSADSKFLATGGSPSITVWDFRGKGPERKRPAVIDYHFDFVTCLSFQPRGRLLASGGKDGRLQVFDIAAVETLMLRYTFPESVASLAWSSDGSLLAGGDAVGNVVVVRVRR